MTFNYKEHYKVNRDSILAERKIQRDSLEARKKRSEYSYQYRMSIKEEVLAHYNPQGVACCIQCGENRIACLTLDHIDNDGYKDRERRKGYNFYLWLKRHNYPMTSLQTLCMNCQFINRQAYYDELREKAYN